MRRRTSVPSAALLEGWAAGRGAGPTPLLEQLRPADPVRAALVLSRLGLAGRAWPEARRLAGHELSPGLFCPPLLERPVRPAAPHSV
jgi:hypothetical protein